MPDATSLSPEMARVAQEAMIKGTKATNTEAQELADSLSKQISAEQVLQTAASTPDFENGASVIDRNTSRKDKESKTIRDSEEDKAKKAGDAAAKYAKELYLKGYENMTQDGKNYVQDKVAANLLNHPALKDMFANLPGGANTAKFWSENMARRFLKDPRYRDSMAKLVSGQMGVDKIIEDVVSSLQVEVDNMTEEKGKLDKRKGELDTDIERWEKEIKEHSESITDAAGREGDVHKKITNLREKAKGIRKDIEVVERDKDPIQEEIDQLTDDLKDWRYERKHGNATQKEKAQHEIESLNSDLSGAKARLREKQQLIREKEMEASGLEREADLKEQNKAPLETRLQEAKKERDQIEEKLNKLTTDLIKNQLELANKKGERTLNMKEFVKELEGVFGKAANELLEADMIKAADHLQKMTLEKATKATNDRDKKVLEKSATLFFKDGKLDKANIKTYRDILMTEATEITFKDEKGVNQKLLLNGAEKALNQLMIDSGINEADRYKNLQDKTFAETQSKAIAKSIIAHKFMTNGWSKKEMQFITESTWGKGLIHEALQQKDAIKAEINEAFGKNSKLFKSGEWLKGNYGWLIAIIAILIALGIFKFMH